MCPFFTILQAKDKKYYSNCLNNVSCSPICIVWTHTCMYVTCSLVLFQKIAIVKTAVTGGARQLVTDWMQTYSWPLLADCRMGIHTTLTTTKITVTILEQTRTVHLFHFLCTQRFIDPGVQSLLFTARSECEVSFFSFKVFKLKAQAVIPANQKQLFL